MTNSPLASVRATRDLMARYGLDTKKALGQHFLIDDNVVGRIIDLAAITPDDTVLEVGPGIGTLTLALLDKAAKVVAIERDADLIPLLNESTAADSHRLRLINADALDVGAAQLAPDQPRLFVANLPYAVAATLVLGFFQQLPFLQAATVMVQSEVADRMVAQPGSKDYGAYTVKLRLHAQASGRFQVSPNCFFPPPRVESSVIRLERQTLLYHGAPASPQLIQAATLAADAAFTQRRKTIRNSMQAALLGRGYSKQCIDDALEQAGINPGLRGETLTTQDFLRLGEALSSAKTALQDQR